MAGFLSQYRVPLGALLIIATTVMIYFPALHGDWVWDDVLYISDNPLMHDPDRVWKAWFQPGSFVDYYPIEETLQWLEWQWWGNDTFWYHIVNLVLHIASALLLWRLLTKLGLRFAWVGGLLFAIHPVQVESVAWLSELKNTLALPPFLMALAAWVDYENHGRKKDYLQALGWFVTAMLCKISMTPFPVVMLLYAWWKRNRIGWRDLKASAPFFAVSLVLGMATIESGKIYFESLHLPLIPVIIGGFLSHVALIGLSLFSYLLLFLWPVGLLPMYPQIPVDPPAPWQFLTWLLFATVVGWCWVRRKTWGRHVLLGLGFFAISILPFAGVIAATYMGFTWVMDHFLYLPIIGLIGLTVAGIDALAKRLAAPLRPAGIALLAVAMATLAWISHGEAETFTDQTTFWRHTVEHNPGAWIAHYGLGVELGKKGDYEGAISSYEKAVTLRPDYLMGRSNLGNALLRVGRVPEAMEQLERARKIHPNSSKSHFDIGNALVQENRYAEAKDQYEQALHFDPNDPDIHYNLGNVLGLMGKIPEAMDQYHETLRLQPGYLPAYSNLGTLLVQTGHLDEGIAQYEQALAINPTFPDAQQNLARARQMKAAGQVKK